MSMLIDFIYAHTPNALVAYLVMFSLPIIAGCLLAGMHGHYQAVMARRDERKRMEARARVMRTFHASPSLPSPAPMTQTVLVADGEIRSTLARIRREGGFITCSAPLTSGGYSVTYTARR